MLNVEAEEPVVPYHTRGLLPTGITIVAASKATSDEFVGVTTRRQKQMTMTATESKLWQIRPPMSNRMQLPAPIVKLG